MSGTEHAGHKDYFGAKLGMWLFLVTEIVLFGGLFIAYAYMWSRYPHEFHTAARELNAAIGVANTVVLLTSSLTMVLGVVAIQRGDKGRALLFTGATILMGLLFLVNKGFEWGAKFHHGIWPSSPKVLQLPGGEQVFFGLYFSMTGLHGLHVLAGIGVLAAMWVLVRRGSIHQGDSVKLENGGLYWHLVDVVWIFLLPLFYFAA
jgi:cytochrome c oxidase subunit III